MSILNPTKTVQVGGIEVTVRDLPWPVMKQFLEKLSHQVSGLIGSAVSSSEKGDAAAIGSRFLDQLPNLVGNSTELAEDLVTKTTGMNAAWLNERTSTEFLLLLDASLEVVFNEDFVRLGKSVAERVQGAFATSPLATTLSARPSTSSSGKDGTMRTRVNSPSPNSSSSAT